MAERKRGARGRSRPPRPALREQVRAVSRELQEKKTKRKAAARPNVEPAPTFDQLASGVRRLARTVTPAQTPAAPPAGSVPTAPPQRARLWVEHQAGTVRALAAGVPARWLAELESGRIVPQRELDLHRKSASDARQAIAAAVREARRAGVRCLLVVCGRGQHSNAAGAVLPDVAVEYLSETLADVVQAFTSAPKKWGGSGAILVRLRPARSAR
ncbi:MAG: Smr/MutS family protein [Deltaproteobacteria bacterium]